METIGNIIHDDIHDDTYCYIYRYIYKSKGSFLFMQLQAALGQVETGWLSLLKGKFIKCYRDQHWEVQITANVRL